MTRAHWLLLSLLPVAYVMGSIPFGLIVGLAKGVDPRKAGSGNIGATNVARLLGKKFFFLVFTLDLLKGLLPMLAAAFIVHRYVAPADRDAFIFLLWILVGFGAIFGHMFSCFIGFKGGKGVATSCGVILGLFPYYTLPAVFVLAVWAIFFGTSRIISLASIAAAASFPIAYAICGAVRHWPILNQQAPLLGFALLVALMIIYKHRANIARLRAGTEAKFGKKTVDGRQ
jgi:glycerol-3-phosphate acyltransferase PlsY